MRGTWSAALALLLAAGCATSEPAAIVYPAKGQTSVQQSKDTSECQTWAKQQSGYDPTTETAKGAGVGALVGAVGGAAVGAAVGAASGAGAGRGAATGAVIGGVGGAVGGGAYQYSKTKDGYDRAFAACMSARGYTVTK